IVNRGAGEGGAFFHGVYCATTAEPLGFFHGQGQPMGVKMASNICTYWDCDVAVQASHFACREHWEAFQEDELEECPNCDNLMSAEYELCRPCEVEGRPRISESRTTYEVESSPAWEAGDEGVDEFYAYILKIDPAAKDSKVFYAGHTRDLRVRMTEHRDGAAKTTRGRNPRLIWFSEFPTREIAATVEAGLKGLIDRNPREIRIIVMRFQDLISDVEPL
ncbi:MAG: GIY-YIG nuclease family protein, partial [Chloroflexi bacterium]|nr:GIY-YIG nuclease family protein [Chloroflexota bacterium]